ncbi:regulator of G-protein signaling 7-like isoform X2 [Ornithodoros turicata]|uniref:regulator of G-protein signaling 7-like isoform X2 n=1 Tax=Ornithodoros turicata TaxID=34597 RepID=UPI0031397F22
MSLALPPSGKHVDGMSPGGQHDAADAMDAADDHYKEPVFAKMEKLIREMQHPESGVPVRSQKLFLTSIPCAFLGYDVVEWLMDNLDIEDPSPVAAEALHLANLLCQHGYFFPVSDNAKSYAIKDDSTLYRFQTPYFWPSRYQPDNTDYAIYLVKRSLRNKQKYALEEYEQEALQRLKKLLFHKWEFICMQAEEQASLAKERKKTEKLILNSQERAYWRIHRPPPGCTSCLEKSPVPNRRGPPRKKTRDDLRREMEILKRNLARSRTKVSQIIQRYEEYKDFDSFLGGVTTNPWITDDPALWTIESRQTDTPSEKRLKRWTLSLEELLSDPTGLREFEIYLRKEYSHENILFWNAVQELRHGSQRDVAQRVRAIHEEYIARGAPCEVNLDGRTLELTQEAVREPCSRFALDEAQQHVFTLMEKDTYPRFLRSEHYRQLLVRSALQQGQRKSSRFFHFGSSTKKKGSNVVSTSTTPQSAGLVAAASGPSVPVATSSGTSSRPATRPLSGSTCDLRRERVEGSEGSGSAQRPLSGRHSHSTSDLHSMDATSPGTDRSSRFFSISVLNGCRLSSPSGSRDFMHELSAAAGARLQVPQRVWGGPTTDDDPSSSTADTGSGTGAGSSTGSSAAAGSGAVTETGIAALSPMGSGTVAGSGAVAGSSTGSGTAAGSRDVTEFEPATGSVSPKDSGTTVTGKVVASGTGTGVTVATDTAIVTNSDTSATVSVSTTGSGTDSGTATAIGIGIDSSTPSKAPRISDVGSST